MRIPTLAIAALLTLTLAACDGSSEPAGKNVVAPSDQPALPDQRVDNPFPTATQVRLYIGDASGQVREQAGRALSPAQRVAFENALYLTTPDEMAACFIPHHFFRYYDKAGKEVGEVAICFCCEGAEATGQDNIKAGPGQVLTAHFDQLGKLVRALGVRTDVAC